MTCLEELTVGSASASSPSACRWKYDVFLSFRGEDTRKGFTDHLYDKLKWRAIKTFRDDPELQRGTSIHPELLLAIQQSRFAIVVISPNYAASTWCLVELTKILQSMDESETILPVFYDVDPSDVRHQKGSFAEAFVKHEEKFREDIEKVQGWRDALAKVANLAGWTSKDYRYETELIKEIVEVVWNKVHPTLTLLDSSEMLVGIEFRLKEICLLLDIAENHVCFIGIWGMGGIGKTTLARLVYEKISHNFEVSIFLANVREIYAKHGLVHLQKQLLSQILKEKDVQVWDVYSGITMAKSFLCNKKALLILDDVDQLNQLEKLVGEKYWFGLGSRIIVTTRDRHLLVAHGIEKQYEVVELDEDEAYQLFNWKAFKEDEPQEKYLELSKQFVKYARGLPLALRTLGSFLYKRDPDAWSSALNKLKQTPNRTVFEMLKISYDGLDEMEKRVFLDIACFHKWSDKERVIEVLDSCGFCARIVIDVLVEKSLLTISGKSVCMHDLIQEMAWEIVRRESFEEPGARSRLWLRDDIFHVLTKNTGTKAIEGIVLRLREFEEAHWNPEAFSKMCNLKLLDIDNLRLSVGPKYLPNALRFLKWSWYPSKFLPPGFQPNELTELSLPHSKIDYLWNGIKYFRKLKSIDLSYSQNLTRTPDFTGLQNLERLVLEGCTNLVEIHPSIASLKCLRILNFRNCKSIKILPNEVKMETLEVFDLSGCSKVKKIPEFGGQMKNVSKLYLGGTAVEELPLSFKGLIESLEELDLTGISIREPLSSIGPMKNLDLSSFHGCNGPPPQPRFSFLPSGLFPRKSLSPVNLVLASLKDFRSLKKLDLSDCNLCDGALPEDIGCLSSLKELNLGGNNFVSLPTSIGCLSKLSFFNLNNCKRLQQLQDLPLNNRIYLKTDNCTSLQMLPGPPELCRLRRFVFSSVNCLRLVGYQGSNNIIYSMLKRFLQEIPHFVDRFSIIIPGCEIPEWFTNQSVGHSLTEKLPLHAGNSEWMGFALCAVFVSHENPAVVREVDYLQTYANEICCQWKIPGSQFEGLSFYNRLDHVVSDHLLLVLLSRQHYNFLEEKHSQIKFGFKTRRAVGNKKCLKVKKCGVRSVYEQDVEDLNRTMNLSNNNNSLHEAVHIPHCDF